MEYQSGITKRRLGAGEILSASMRGVFGPRFWDLLVPSLVAAALWIGLFAAVSPAFTDLIISNWAVDEETNSVFFRQFMTIWSTVMLGSLILCLVFTPYLLHRMHLAVSGGTEPVMTTIRRALDFRVITRFAISLVLGAILYMIGGMLMIVPGLALIPVVSLIPACATFDERARFFSLASAFGVMGNSYWRTAGVLVAYALGFLFFSLLFSVPFMMWQSDSLDHLSHETDPQVILDAQKEVFFSPEYLIPTIISGLVQIGYLLLVLFSTVLVYFNDRFEKRGFVPEGLPASPYPDQ